MRLSALKPQPQLIFTRVCEPETPIAEIGVGVAEYGRIGILLFLSPSRAVCTVGDLLNTLSQLTTVG